MRPQPLLLIPLIGPRAVIGSGRSLGRIWRRPALFRSRMLRRWCDGRSACGDLCWASCRDDQLTPFIDLFRNSAVFSD